MSLKVVGGVFHSNFNRLFCKQTVEILIRHRVLRRLISCTVCPCPIHNKRTLDLISVNNGTLYYRLGGLNQGESVVTDPLDNDNFALIWTCFRKAPENPDEGEPDCMDVGLEIMTRERIPSPAVIAMIEASLDANFGMSLSDLKQVSQADGEFKKRSNKSAF